jgi:hypothetical protein
LRQLSNHAKFQNRWHHCVQAPFGHQSVVGGHYGQDRRHQWSNVLLASAAHADEHCCLLASKRFEDGLNTDRLPAWGCVPWSGVKAEACDLSEISDQAAAAIAAVG